MTSYWWIQFKAWNNTSWSCANKTWILTDFFSVVSTLAMFNGIEITKEKKKNEDVARYERVKLFDQKETNKKIVGNFQSKSLAQWPILFLIMIFLCRFDGYRWTMLKWRLWKKNLSKFTFYWHMIKMYLLTFWIKSINNLSQFSNRYDTISFFTTGQQSYHENRQDFDTSLLL